MSRKAGLLMVVFLAFLIVMLIVTLAHIIASGESFPITLAAGALWP